MQFAVEVVEATDAELGMGVTLAVGIRATQQSSGWVVALGNMPSIRVETLHHVTSALRAGTSIVAPYYDDQRGHPVGFARTWGDALGALRGDEGARSLLRDQSICIERINVHDPGCLFDVDTPGDLERLATGAAACAIGAMAVTTEYKGEFGASTP